jgi:hypothetical protein
MAPLLILPIFLMAASATYVLYLLVKIVSAWWRNERVMEQGEMLSVRIVRVEVMDAGNPLVPFVTMKLEVSAEENFLCTAEGFYQPCELPYLQVGNYISAVLHPTDKRKIQLVKDNLNAPTPKQTTSVLAIRPKRKLSVA